jgi:hypothetical protein
LKKANRIIGEGWWGGVMKALESMCLVSIESRVAGDYWLIVNFYESATTTPSCHSRFSNPASQPTEDLSNWRATKQPMATSTNR